MFDFCSYRLEILGRQEITPLPARSQAPIIVAGGIMVVIPIIIINSSRQRANVLTGLQQAGAAAECPPRRARIMMETPHFPRSYAHKSGWMMVLFDAMIDFHLIFEREQWISTRDALY